MILHYFFISAINITQKLNNDLTKVNQYVYQWKMSFKIDPIKQAQEENKQRILSFSAV